MTDMSDTERSDELDRRIEARRRGEETPPDADLDALVDAADALEQRWSAAATVDEDAVWAKVAAEIEQTPQRGWRAFRRRFRVWPPPVGRRLPAIAAVALIMLAVGAAALLTSGGSANAQFLEDVRELSAAATTALDDGTLDQDELNLLNELTAKLLATVRDDPAALAGLAVDDLKAAVATMAVVVGLIESGDHEARDDDDGGGGVASSLASLSVASGIVVAAVAEELVEDAAAACDGVTDEAGLEACEQAVDEGEDACDALGHDAGHACEEELEALEHAAKGDVEVREEQIDGAESCDELAAVDAGLGARCVAAVAPAAAACDGVNDEAGLDACEDAVAAGEDACDALGHDAENACEEELEALAHAAEEDVEVREEQIDRAESCDELAAVDAGLGAQCVAAVAPVAAACAAVNDEAGLDACEDAVTAGEDACDALGHDAEDACEEELEALAHAAEQALERREEDDGQPDGDDGDAEDLGLDDGDEDDEDDDEDDEDDEDDDEDDDGDGDG